MTYASFDTTKTHLIELLKDSERGKIQLPDFQRGWVWDDGGIRSLLASISQSFPCGAIMTLQTGGDVRFQPRGIQGREAALKGVNPDTLLLDGQQRITSLYQACVRNEVIETVNAQRRKIKRWYYIDMQAALDSVVDREEAILGLPENKIITRDFGREVVIDLSERKNEFENLCFPVNKVFDWQDWMMRFFQHWNHEQSLSQFWFRFQNEVLNVFAQYQMPVISLGKETPREAVCIVFEKVNTGGKKLDAFELLTAIFAAEEFNLRDDWYGSKDHPKDWPGRINILSRYEALKELASTDFLQALSLLHTHDKRRTDIAEGKESKQLTQVSCQRAAILNLPLSAYRRWADAVMYGFEKAAKFLAMQKIYWRKDIPYRTQLVPLAAILVRLGDRAEVDAVQQKLTQWYWCGVFGELYGSAIETRFALDLQQVPDWIDGSPIPKTVQDANFAPDRLHTLTSRLSAAYKGVHALLMKKGAEDFKTGKPFEYASFWDESVDIHHVFPRTWCQKTHIDKRRTDSIVNKTPLASRTNRIIGGDAPSRYLAKLQRDFELSDERLVAILRSHLIDVDCVARDDFSLFFQLRAEELLKLIERAMGKQIVRTATEEEDIGDLVEEMDDVVDQDEPAIAPPENLSKTDTRAAE